MELNILFAIKFLFFMIAVVCLYKSKCYFVKFTKEYTDIDKKLNYNQKDETSKFTRCILWAALAAVFFAMPLVVSTRSSYVSNCSADIVDNEGECVANDKIISFPKKY